MYKSVAQKVIFELRKVLEDAAINIQDKLDCDELCDIMPDKDINKIKAIEENLNNAADNLYALELDPIYHTKHKGNLT